MSARAIGITTSVTPRTKNPKVRFDMPRWQKGQSGNPKGRPRGSRNKKTIAAEKLFGENSVELTQTAIGLAKDKNVTALRMCLEQIYPKARDRMTPFDLPQMAAPKDAVGAVGTIVQAVAKGELTTAQAGQLIKVVNGFSQTLWDQDIEQRLRRVEQKLNEKK
jgi:Family of unknown function (DUF5681)